MRYLMLYKPGEENNAPPSPEEMAKMGRFIEETVKAGVLLATEGCLPSAMGFRVDVQAGKYTVTDGPFPETKELIAGFALVQVKSKAEAIEWAKRFLAVVGKGQSEVRQVMDQPTAGS
jgi:hypothetical protein